MSGKPPGSTPPRSLAEALRSRDDASLAELLRARPDLLAPVPGDLTQLATRAGTRASVLRALERLDRFTQQVAEALAVAPDPAGYEDLLRLVRGADPGAPEDGPGAGSDGGAGDVERALPRAVTVLREQALLWGDDAHLRLVRTARELLTPGPQHPSPTGLGPSVAETTAGMSPGRIQQIVTTAGLATTHDSVSAVAALAAVFEDRERMDALLAEAPAASLEVLDRLVWGPPYGQVTAEPAARLRWLLDRGLLLPTAPGTVVLPREVALHLRGGRAHRTPEPLAPAVRALAEHRPQVVDATAAGQAYMAVTTVEDLLRDWDEGGPAVLRAGGLSVRDLKRTAVALDVSEPVAAFWVELAYTAGLLAADGQADERYAATPAYDEWLERSPAERWATLAAAWLTATRTAGLVGGRDPKDRALSALGPGLDRGAAPEVRHRVLALLAELPVGTAPAPDSVLARLRWERPPRSAVAGGRIGGPGSDPLAEDPRGRLARWTLDQAELLGVTGRGALSAHGRELLGRPDERDVSGALDADALARAVGRAAGLLGPLIPHPLDHVLLQADLTAVAPGPLERPLADTLAVLADVESKGGATVYRFTPASVRRALDAGRTAGDLHAFLATHSRTPVPQPLTYLIDDVARRHGQLRIGAASAYVRCDDDSVLGEILADRRAQGLRLRRLAPTVLATQADPASLLDQLRAMGFAPAAETPDGDVMIARIHAYRTGPRTPPEPAPEGPPRPDDILLRAAVRAVRAGDLAATAPRKSVPEQPGELPRTSPPETLATMQAAVMTGQSLWIGYVSAEGAASQRVIAPVRVEGGYVTGYDHTADEVRTYPLHRITGVAELADDD
ncbi:helicase-associated domain-containing protein [Streptomyces sp. NPDC059816]|uniref:helicase-associated domain-containing protein n=1 Tax=Streptomyces sp. NPDC059816 TaxID=3346960 RepID=UPI0036637CAB